MIKLSSVEYTKQWSIIRELSNVMVVSSQVQVNVQEKYQSVDSLLFKI